jgi:hypothetical protein
MQSHFEEDLDLYLEIISSNSALRSFQSISVRAEYALQAEQTPFLSNLRSGFVEGRRQFVQYLII